MSRPIIAIYGPNPSSPHRTGGVAKWIRYLSQIYREAAVDTLPLYIDIKRIDALPIPSLLKRGIGALECALQLLRRYRTGDRVVVHVNTSLYRTTGLRDLPIVAAAKIRGFPVLLQVHGGRLSNVASNPFAHRIWKWIFDRSDILGIHPGPQWREFEKKGYESKLQAMYNAVPSTPYKASLQRDTAHFLFLGRLTEEKGVDKLLNVVLRLRNEGCANVELTIAGTGPLVDKLRSLAGMSPHSHAIDIPGFVEGDAFDKVLNRANVFVLPSRHQEGFPFSFLECAERGMACLITKNSAIPEVFQEGVEFEPIDLNEPDDLYQKMKRAAEDVRHRAALGTAVQQAVRECCTIEAAAQRFKNIYRDLIRTEK